MADQRTYKMLLSEIESGVSDGLPDYSEANDGDVLAIDNGEPVWSAPGGGIADLVVHASFTENYDDQTGTTSYSVTADMTPSEVQQHLDEIEFVVIALKDDAGGLQCVLTPDGYGHFVWSFVDLENSPASITSVILSVTGDEWAMAIYYGAIPSNE